MLLRVVKPVAAFFVVIKIVFDGLGIAQGGKLLYLIKEVFLYVIAVGASAGI